MRRLSVEIYKRFMDGEDPERLMEQYKVTREGLKFHVKMGLTELHYEEYISATTYRPIQPKHYGVFAKEGGASYVRLGDDIYCYYGYPNLKYYCRASGWERSAAYKRLMGG